MTRLSACGCDFVTIQVYGNANSVMNVSPACAAAASGVTQL